MTVLMYQQKDLVAIETRGKGCGKQTRLEDGRGGGEGGWVWVGAWEEVVGGRGGGERTGWIDGVNISAEGSSP